KYNVVGGFSFYERAEIKDMISYLKLLQNPDDSIAFLRVVNTPTRGIGKTTLETLERIALETGASLWTGMEQAIQQKLLPTRAVAALSDFKQIIEDGRAMLLGSFAAKLEADAASPSTQHSALSIQPLDDTAVAQTPSPVDEEAEEDETDFDFGQNDQHELFGTWS